MKLPDNLPEDELFFLSEQPKLSEYFYGILLDVKNKDEPLITNILCKNSYERRIVHILAHSLGLYHSRLLCYLFDWNCCRCGERSWKTEMGKCTKIIGVKVANVPIYLSKKDKIHQKMTRFI